MINTIGKKIHTLVKENTPCCHKIRQECGFTQNIFLCIIVFFFPTVMQILVGRLDSYLLTHTKKYMTPIHALIFQKHVKMCVYIWHIKSWCKFITLWGSMCSKKRLAEGSFYQNSGSQGTGHVSPAGGSSRAAPSSRFFMFFWGLVGPPKSQCKTYDIC